jgi:hypothetical protein
MRKQTDVLSVGMGGAVLLPRLPEEIRVPTSGQLHETQQEYQRDRSEEVEAPLYSKTGTVTTTMSP